jgi:hypothetical protein
MNIFHSDAVPFDLTIDKRGRKPKYPLRQLGIHEGFIVPAEDAPKFRSIRLLAKQIGRLLGKKFLLKQEPDGSIVVWRES